MSKIFNYNIFTGIIKIISFLRKIYFLQLSLLYKSQLKKCGKGIRFENGSVLRGTQFISIGSNCNFQKHLCLTAWEKYKDQKLFPSITIGNNCNFGAFNHITCTNKIIIGNNVLTGKWVTISDNNHGDTSYQNMIINPQDRKIVSKGRIYIGDRVFIGDKATILSGVNIGEGSIIGANAVITKDIPPFCVAVGNPARIICNNSIYENE